MKFKKFICIVLTLTVTFAVLPVLADSDSAILIEDDSIIELEKNESDYIRIYENDDIEEIFLPEEDLSFDNAEVENYSGLESSWDGRNYGWVTSVKETSEILSPNYAVTACLETSILKQGYEQIDIDVDDYISQRVYRLYDDTWNRFKTVDGSDAVHIVEIGRIEDFPGTNSLKNIIKEYGSFTLSLADWVKDYPIPEIDPEHYSIYNWIVQCVGWDDNHENDDGSKGAWLVKDCLGTSYGDNGFWWVAYDHPNIQFNYNTTTSYFKAIPASEDYAKQYYKGIHDEPATIESEHEILEGVWIHGDSNKNSVEKIYVNGKAIEKINNPYDNHEVGRYLLETPIILNKGDKITSAYDEINLITGGYEIGEFYAITTYTNPATWGIKYNGETLTGEVEIKAGESIAVTPIDCAISDISFATDDTKGYVTINNGIVTVSGAAADKARITVTATKDGISTTFVVVVKGNEIPAEPTPVNPSPNPTSIPKEPTPTVEPTKTPTPEKTSCFKQNTLRINKGSKVSCGFENNTGKKVTYKSSNTKVVTVDSKGKLTAKGKGKATISAKVDGKTYKCTVYVYNPTISGKAQVTKGKTITLKIKDGYGKTTWKSSNKKIATVDKNGKVKGKKKGTVTITAKNNGKTIKKTVKVK